MAKNSESQLDSCPDPQPDWDMTPYFPEFDGETYRAFRAALADDVAALAREVEALGAIEASNIAAWAGWLQRLEDVTARSTHLASYLGCLGAADSRNEAIQRETASADVAGAELAKLFVALRAALGTVGDDAFAALVAQPALSGATHYLERLRTSARFRMEAPLEALAADLNVNAMSAWARLYNQVSGRLEFELDGKRVPVSASRSLLESPNAEVRRAAFAGANAAWESVGDVAAACLNAISGVRHTLYRRRGVAHFLEPALFDASISRPTLDALLGAAEDRRDVPHRYLRRKAQLLGKEKLGFQDLLAPLPVKGASAIAWSEARERIVAAFERFYPDLAAFAGRAFADRWLDYSPRPGKRPGGFCSTSPVIGQSRVFVTYNQTLGDLAIVAHELGHAFHGALMRDMRWWSRHYPMTLAETASTFAEQLVIDAVLEDPDTIAEQRAVVLDSRMQDGATFLLNIPMRFYFEQALYEERANGELSVSRLKELMLDAQRRCYGDCLAEDELDPWFWASKLHFYITGISFYNFPYLFGYLFSMGIFARAKEEGPGFLKEYEALLRLTGSDSAEGVAKRSLGVDLTRPDFWHASIDLIEAGLGRFDEAAAAL